MHVTVTTEACNAYAETGEFPELLWEQVLAAMSKMESQTSKLYGGSDNPLLVGVRSGAKFSMPGMMDTVLNVGLNDDVAESLIERTRDARDSSTTRIDGSSRCSPPSYSTSTKPRSRAVWLAPERKQESATTPISRPRPCRHSRLSSNDS